MAPIYNAEENPVQFDWHGAALLGVHHRGNSADTPGVLYIHGMPGDRVDTRRLPVRMARRLQARGVAGLRVDLYGSGVSDGSFSNVTFLDELKQVLFLIEEIRKQGLWKGPTLLLGFSEAGKLAIRAAQNNADVAGLCLWNGVIAPEPPGTEKKLLRLQRVAGQLVFDIGYGVWVHRDILAETKQLCAASRDDLPDVPVLAVYGGADPITRTSREFLVQCGYAVEIIPGADHLFTSTAWEESLIAITEQWVYERFCLNPGIRKACGS